MLIYTHKAGRQAENLTETSQAPERSSMSQDKIKEVKDMKKYEVTVDGYKVGIVELYPEEVKELNKDAAIIIKEVKTCRE